MTRKPFHHESSEVRRQDLIAATLDCIGRLGLKGATVREIAKSAGVTGGLIRHYFTSKDKLFEAAYLDLMDMMSATAMRQAEDGGADPRIRLRIFIEANYKAPLIDPHQIALWATFIGQLQQARNLAAIHRRGYLNFRNALEKLVAEVLAHEGRTVTPAEMRHLAIAVNGIIDGLWLEACMAADLFAEGELGEVAVSAIEKIIDVKLPHPSP